MVPVSWFLVLIACGGGTELEKPNPPPDWPLSNIREVPTATPEQVPTPGIPAVQPGAAEPAEAPSGTEDPAEEPEGATNAPAPATEATPAPEAAPAPPDPAPPE